MREDRGVSQATGDSGPSLPEEFRAGLGRVFQQAVEVTTDEKPIRPHDRGKCRRRAGHVGARRSAGAPGPPAPAAKAAQEKGAETRAQDPAVKAQKKADAGREAKIARTIAIAEQQILMKGVVGRPANLENLVQQYMRQARPLVRAELIFVRKVCSLELEQFRWIHQDIETAFKDAITKIVEGQQQGRVRAAGPIQRTPASGAIALLRERLASVMKNDLTPAQFARYEVEVEKRDAFQKESAVRYLVDAVDREVYLSDDQRQKLTDSLSSRWDPSWTPTLEYLLYGNQFFPAGIDPYVTPYLDLAQKKIWAGAQRVGALGGTFPMLGSFMTDPDALGPELGEDKKAGSRKESPVPEVDAPKFEFRKVQLREGVAREAAPKK